MRLLLGGGSDPSLRSFLQAALLQNALEPPLGGTFRRFGLPYFGVLIITILLFRVLYWGPLFSEPPPPPWYPKIRAPGLSWGTPVLAHRLAAARDSHEDAWVACRCFFEVVSAEPAPSYHPKGPCTQTVYTLALKQSL